MSLSSWLVADPWRRERSASALHPESTVDGGLQQQMLTVRAISSSSGSDIDELLGDGGLAMGHPMRLARREMSRSCLCVPELVATSIP